MNSRWLPIVMIVALASAGVPAADPPAEDEQAQEQQESQEPATAQPTEPADTADEDTDNERATPPNNERETEGQVEVGDVDAIFVPSEDISADTAISFPADI